MSKGLEEIIKEKILIFDGAIATYVENLKFKNQKSKFRIDSPDYTTDVVEDWTLPKYEGPNEYLCFSRPDLIEKVHSDYLLAGADVIETNTFNANRIVLSEYGLENQVKELNTKAARIAIECANKYSTKDNPRFVAGSIGPTTKSIFVTGGISFDQMKQVYFEQISALIEGGVDILLFETSHDILNLKSGLKACIEAFEKYGRQIPVIVSVSMDEKDLMLSGHTPESAYISFEHFPLFAFGFNCSTGPKDMAIRLKTLSKISKFPVFAMPNAGIPDAHGKYPQSPEEFSETMKTYAQSGFLNIAGGCCGTTPEHIKILVKKLEGIKPRKIETKSHWAVSGIDAFFYEKITPPVLVGERNNSVGSKKFRELISNGKWDGAVEIAKSQIRQGAHLLDICLSNPERNELEDTKIFLPKLFRSVRSPVMIDTTDEKVMEEALKLAPGKCILNSVNFEFGEEKPRRIAKLALTYGAKIVFGVIDEDKKQGMPVFAERKIAIAQRGYEFFTQKCKLPPEDIILDALVFPVGLGGEYTKSALETLHAIELMKKKFPLSKTLLGISNVSFGLPPQGRDILNLVFLLHAVKSGLDLAIVNVEKLLRYVSISEVAAGFRLRKKTEEIKLAENLLFARTENSAKEFAEYFRSRSEIRSQRSEVRSQRSEFSEEKLRKLILEGSKQNLEEIINELLKKMLPMEIVNGPVLKAMAEVGKLFSSGKMIVTEVLQSAEVTQKIIYVLEPMLKSSDKTGRGKLLLATVKGDVHDIGKNLVGIIFRSNGFEVIDLGVKVPSEVIVEKSLQEKPDFIGLSGLLVRSIEQMAITAKELKKARVSVPIIVGGAAITEKAVFAKIKPEYIGPVFYASDAMSGLNIALKYKSEIRSQRSGVRSQKSEVGNKKNKPSLTFNFQLSTANLHYYPDKIPQPPDFERHILKDFDLNELFKNLNYDLFNMRFLKVKKDNIKKVSNVQKTMEQFKKEIISKKIIKANAIYQFFGANSDGNSIKIFDSISDRVLEIIDFPRQTSGEKLSIADFILPVLSGKKDFLAFFITTCGQGIMEFSKTQREKGNFLKSYIIEALALSLSEAFAEIIHRLICEVWQISSKQGKRYSFGYPACPDLSNQTKLFKLLMPEDIGVKLTENFMMEPEASVSGFVLHNPKSKYFSLLTREKLSKNLKKFSQNME